MNAPAGSYIRTFDLRLGEQFKTLFEGAPPSNQYIDLAFPKVRHIHVPRWSNEELAEVLEKAPMIATAIERAGDRLRDLAGVPFNTRLLADLIGGGLSADAFGDVSLQVQLLALYWQHRVEQYGSGADLCLRTAVAQTLARDPHPAVRLAVASRLAMLWNTARVQMWELADVFGNSEPNRRVLSFFAAF
jgi:hypothetical protein